MAKKKKGGKSLKVQFSLCKAYFQTFKVHTVAALILFCLSFLVGLFFPLFFQEEIFNFIKELSASIQGKSSFDLMVFIFFNNIKASFLAFAMGIGLGLFPILTTVVNGYILGFVSNSVIASEGILVLWRLFPHGIFEIPAVLLSIGLGFKLGFDIFRKDPIARLKHNIREGIRFFVFIIFPLLLIAGIIEGLLIGLGI